MEIAGVELEHCIFNAAGPRCTTEEELKALGEADGSAIMTKSCTLEPREGNPEPRYVDIEHGSINSMGLPNLGYEKYAELVPMMKEYGKPVILSVSGLSLSDNITILEAYNKTDADLIELNLSCPNVPGKPQVAYDFGQTRDVLEKTLEMVEKPMGVKLPPYFDFVHFEQMAEILNEHKPAFVSCINSIGNGIFIDVEKEAVVIKPKKGFGGIGGSYVNPTALANVRKFYELLEGIDIMGVGGVRTGEDVFEHLLCGAKAVQVGTALMQEGTSIFARLRSELDEVMERKGYSDIDEFRGALKEI